LSVRDDTRGAFLVRTDPVHRRLAASIIHSVLHLGELHGVEVCAEILGGDLVFGGWNMALAEFIEPVQGQPTVFETEEQA
jgi:hypothetical protein